MQPHEWVAISQVQEASGLNVQWQCSACGARRTEEPGRHPPEHGDSGCRTAQRKVYEKKLEAAGVGDNGQYINYEGGHTIQLDGHFNLRELEALCAAWRELGET